MQWLLLKNTRLYDHDDYRIRYVQSLEECKERCISLLDGPCKSFDWIEPPSPFHNCLISRADQHSDSAMLTFSDSFYVENCEGKSTLSHSFDQENN